MKVMVIVKASKASEAGEMPSQQLLTEMGKFNEELAKAGIMLAGEGLHPSCKGARVEFGGKQRKVIDGPFPETKELIAGFWMWKVKSMEEAIEWVKRCPNPHNEAGHIEIRPVFSAEDFGAEFTPELRQQEAGIRAQTLGLGAVRYETSNQLVIAGINSHYTKETRSQIPAQWQRFVPQIGKVPGQIGAKAYGVCWNAGDNCEFDYLCGVEVAESATQPASFTQVVLPARQYVVFTHDEHVSEFPKTIDKIWSQWAPECGLPIAHAPCFERYTEEFDMNRKGGMELWIPLDA